MPNGLGTHTLQVTIYSVKFVLRHREILNRVANISGGVDGILL